MQSSIRGRGNVCLTVHWLRLRPSWQHLTEPSFFFTKTGAPHGEVECRIQLVIIIRWCDHHWFIGGIIIRWSDHHWCIGVVTFQHVQNLVIWLSETIRIFNEMCNTVPTGYLMYVYCVETKPIVLGTVGVYVTRERLPTFVIAYLTITCCILGGRRAGKFTLSLRI